VGTPPPPAPVVTCTVPNVVGKTTTYARRAIFNADCAVGRVTSLRAKKKKGTVLAQRPRAGTRLAEGGRVNLLVSKGKKRPNH
jgi:beta-lactam-binding protein with PASTA domain